MSSSPVTRCIAVAGHGKRCQQSPFRGSPYCWHHLQSRKVPAPSRPFRVTSGRPTDISGEPATLIFYEAPHRIAETLSDIAAVMPTREVVAARELTKLHEEVLRGTAAEIHAKLASRDSIRGEFVVLISKATEPDAADTPIEDAIELMVAAGLPRMDAIKTLARERGLSKREVYKLVSIKSKS